MTATDGFILRNTPILGRTAVTHHLFEIHLSVFIPPVSFPSRAPSAAKSSRSRCRCTPASGQQETGSEREAQGLHGDIPRVPYAPSHPRPRHCLSRRRSSPHGTRAGCGNQERRRVSARRDAGGISSRPLSTQVSAALSPPTPPSAPSPGLEPGAGGRALRGSQQRQPQPFAKVPPAQGLHLGQAHTAGIRMTVPIAVLPRTLRWCQKDPLCCGRGGMTSQHSPYKTTPRRRVQGPRRISETSNAASPPRKTDSKPPASEAALGDAEKCPVCPLAARWWQRPTQGGHPRPHPSAPQVTLRPRVTCALPALSSGTRLQN